MRQYHGLKQRRRTLRTFTLALRHSGANANAQLILPGENFSKENSDKF